MPQPILEDQLLGLPPKSKIYLGMILAVAGAVVCQLLWDQGWLAGLPILALVMGVLMFWTGRQELARERDFEREVSRAESEWEELRTGIADAEREGRSVARYLQQQGYEEYAVRRWITEELSSEAKVG